jgi:hypothetical protein
MVLGSAATLQGGEAPVSLELATGSGLPVGAHQRWMQFLQDFDFTHVRIRSARAGDEPKIENRGSDSAPRYAVTGMLTGDGRLALPGALVRYGQGKELSAWLEKLRQGGVDAATSPTGAFGLTAKQLATLRDTFRTPVAMPTKGKPVRELVRHVRRMIDMEIEVDASASTVLSENNTVLDELQGVGCGTALAAAVRPYGLLLTPTGQGTRTVGLRITKNATLEDAWPIGLPIDKGVGSVAPVLMKFINVEIVDQPLDKTLDAIQQRLEIPFLYDRNALAQHEVDLQEKVNFAPKRTFYKKIIDQLLFQKLLVCELRTDAGGRPFLWITSAK